MHWKCVLSLRLHLIIRCVPMMDDDFPAFCKRSTHRSFGVTFAGNQIRDIPLSQFLFRAETKLTLLRLLNLSNESIQMSVRTIQCIDASSTRRATGSIRFILVILMDG
jgi:hypothetical protein